eukprot:1384844-Rhodomonas_salina.3
MQIPAPAPLDIPFRSANTGERLYPDELSRVLGLNHRRQEPHRPHCRPTSNTNNHLFRTALHQECVFPCI